MFGFFLRHFLASMSSPQQSDEGIHHFFTTKTKPASPDKPPQTKSQLKLKFWRSLASLTLRVVLVIWLLIGLYHFWRYGNAAYNEIHAGVYKQHEEAQDLFRNYCMAPGAPSDRMYSDTCLGARSTIHSDVRHKIVMQWMEQHMLKLPFFNVFRVGDWLERVVVVVVEAISWWNVIKALILCVALHKSVKLVFPLMVEVFRLFHEMRMPLVVPIVNPIPTKVQ